jgi:arylsulfatase A-like enzyme
MLREFNEGRLRTDRIYFECPIDGDGVRSGIAEYDNEIAYADRHVGRLLDYLEREGLFENTLVAAVSDHGEALGEHGLTFAHSFTLYDEIQKVVLILKPPGWNGRRTVGVQVRLLDFMPTVLSLLGLDDGEGLEGRDLSPLWLDEGREQEFESLPAYAESEPRYRNRKGAFRYPLRKRAHLEGNAGKWRMIRSNGFKLILVPGEGMELYDLAADPEETRNVIHEHPGVADRLQALLKETIAREKSRPPRAGAPLDAGDSWYRLFKEMGY